MGRSKRNRNKRGRNPAVAPPFPAGQGSSSAPAAAAPKQPEEQIDLELSEKDLQGDAETVQLIIALNDNFQTCKTYMTEMENAKSLVTGEDFKELYQRKWILKTKEALISLIHDIRETEIMIKLKEGKATPRPSEIQNFITLVDRIV